MIAHVIKILQGLMQSAQSALSAAGLSPSETRAWLKLEDQERTRELIARYDSGLEGAMLAGLLRSVKLLGRPVLVADFLCELIQGPPLAAQLLALRIAERPEFRRFEKVDLALREYQAEFDSLTQAFSYYQDRASCGCRSRACLPKP